MATTTLHIICTTPLFSCFQVKYKKHKRANSNPSNGKSSSTPSTPGPQSMPNSTSGMDLDPFRRPRSESSGSGLEPPTTKFIVNTDPASSCGMTTITNLPIVSSPSSMPLDMYPNPNKGLLGGVNILRAALTGSNDVISFSFKLLQPFLQSILFFILFLFLHYRYLSNTRIWADSPKTNMTSSMPNLSMS